MNRKHYLVRPPRQSFFFSDIHGITWEKVCGQPTFAALWPEIQELVVGAEFLAVHERVEFRESMLYADLVGLSPKRSSFVASAIDIGTLITQSPEICDGRPRVSGTAVSVTRIAGWYRLGYNAEEIARKTDLTLAQIHATLAYYHANQQTIDSDLDKEASEYDRLAGSGISCG